jgi:hypothetical protein
MRIGTVMIVVSLAGCGGDAGSRSADATQAPSANARPANPGGPTLAACAVLTADDVAAIIGGTATASPSDTRGTWAPGAHTSVCNYTVSSPDLVSLTLTQPASPAGGAQGLAAEIQKDVTSSHIPAGAVQAIDGLGEAAAGYRLQPEAGGTWYVVAQKGSVRLIATAGTDAVARAMIAKAMGRV